MTPTDPNKEAIKKQPAPVETVDDLISKKDTERRSEGMAKVMEQAGQVQGEVADVMAGMEAPSEQISERNREDKKGDLGQGSGATQSDDDDQAQAQIRSSLMRRGLPTEEVMIRKIRTAIQLQIKDELKKAASLKKTVTTGGAQEYNASIAKIRTLKQVLSSIFHNTFEKVKEVYFRFFGDDGRRKKTEF